MVAEEDAVILSAAAEAGARVLAFLDVAAARGEVAVDAGQELERFLI